MDMLLALSSGLISALIVLLLQAVFKGNRLIVRKGTPLHREKYHQDIWNGEALVCVTNINTRVATLSGFEFLFAYDDGESKKVVYRENKNATDELQLYCADDLLHSDKQIKQIDCAIHVLPHHTYPLGITWNNLGMDLCEISFLTNINGHLLNRMMDDWFKPKFGKNKNKVSFMDAIMGRYENKYSVKLS